MFLTLMACLLIVVPKVTSDSSYHQIRQHVMCIQAWLREDTSHVSVESNRRNCVVGVVTKDGLKKNKKFNLTFNYKEELGTRMNYTYGCRKDKKGTGIPISMYCSVRRTYTRSSDENNYTEGPSNNNTFITGPPANNTLNTPSPLSTEIQDNLHYTTLNNMKSSIMSEAVTHTTSSGISDEEFIGLSVFELTDEEEYTSSDTDEQFDGTETKHNDSASEVKEKSTVGVLREDPITKLDQQQTFTTESNTNESKEQSTLSDLTNSTTASKSKGTLESNDTEQPPFTNSTTAKHLWKTQSDMTTKNLGYTDIPGSSIGQTTSASRSTPKAMDCSGCCGRAPAVEHAVVSECSNETLVYACQKGFTATRPITISCGASCKWTKTYVRCRDPCGKPPEMKHAFVRSSQADVAMYKCSKGYVNTGRHLITSCRKGKWSRLKGKCKVSFKKPVVVGKFKDKRLTEVSGLAASRQHPGYFYSHNDYHSKPELFLIDIKTVKIVAVYTLIGAKNNDWEDIAVGPCTQGETKGDSCVFIGDFGGHTRRRSIRPANVIYKVKEPSTKRSMHMRLKGKFHFSWDASDADTLLMTPSGYMYAITSDDHKKYIYFFSTQSFERHHTVKPHKLHKIHIRSTVRGGDVSPDGSTVVLSTKSGFYYWEVEGEHVGAATENSKPRYIEKKIYGGGTAFNLDSSGVYVLHEDLEPLYFFERRGMT